MPIISSKTCRHDEKIVDVLQKVIGKINKMTIKKQYKYATAKININLFKSKEKQFEEGRWSTYIKGEQIFSRWFPAEWNLKQRQERDRFQGIRDLEVKNEDDIMESIFKVSKKYAALNYKAIKTNNKHQVIALFRNESRLREAIQKSEKAEKEDHFKWKHKTTQGIPPATRGLQTRRYVRFHRVLTKFLPALISLQR